MVISCCRIFMKISKKSNNDNRYTREIWKWIDKATETYYVEWYWFFWFKWIIRLTQKNIFLSRSTDYRFHGINAIERLREICSEICGNIIKTTTNSGRFWSVNKPVKSKSVFCVETKVFCSFLPWIRSQLFFDSSKR